MTQNLYIRGMGRRSKQQRQGPPNVIPSIAQNPPANAASASKSELTEHRPTVRLYKNKWRNRLSIFFGTTMALIGVISLVYGAFASKEEMIQYVIFWALGPPIYFFIEYQILFDNWEDSKKLEHLRHLQGLAEKIWAAVLALLILFYFK